MKTNEQVFKEIVNNCDGREIIEIIEDFKRQSYNLAISDFANHLVETKAMPQVWADELKEKLMI